MSKIKEQGAKIGKLPMKIVIVTKISKSVEISEKVCYNIIRIYKIH